MGTSLCVRFFKSRRRVSTCKLLSFIRWRSIPSLGSTIFTVGHDWHGFRVEVAHSSLSHFHSILKNKGRFLFATVFLFLRLVCIELDLVTEINFIDETRALSQLVLLSGLFVGWLTMDSLKYWVGLKIYIQLHKIVLLVNSLRYVVLDSNCSALASLLIVVLTWWRHCLKVLVRFVWVNSLMELLRHFE